MATQQILFLTSSSLHLYFYQARDLEYVASFAASPAGMEEFDAYLGQAETVTTRMLVDLIEEDFRIETIAHVVGRDRQALLDRHAARLFRGTAYRHARVLNRVSGNRHKDEALFSGLIGPEFIEMWTAVLERHGVPLVGIYSLPLLTGRVARHLLGRNEDVLFVSESLDSGLRQTFLRGGELRFSRLTAVPEALDAAQYADFVHTEIGRTKRYLANLHLVERDTPLRVAILSGGARSAGLEAHIRDEELTHLRVLDLSAAARKLGYKSDLQTHYSESIFAHLVAHGRVRDHYSQATQRGAYRRHLQHRGLQAASLVLGAIGLIATAHNVNEARQYQAGSAHLQQMFPAVRNRYQQARARLPTTDLSAEGIQSAVRLAQTLRDQRLLPGPLLARIGQHLQRHDALVLDELVWLKSFDATVTEVGTALKDDAGDVDADPGSMPGSSGGGQGGQGLYRVVLMRGHLSDFDGNYRLAHDRIEAFLTDLRRGSGTITAEALELPLNVNSNAPVSGGSQDGDQPLTAAFALRIVMKEEAGHARRL